MIHKMTRRTALGGGLGAAFSLAAPHVARAAVKTLKISYSVGPSTSIGEGTRTFADAVAADPILMNLVKIEPRSNAELGDDLPAMKNVINGTLDMSIAPTLVVSTVCPEVGLLDMPFLFSSVERGRAALDGATGEEYIGLLKAKNVNALVWFENGLRHITSNRPVRGPGDIKGLKIRVPQSAIVLDAFKSLGAEARSLPFGEFPEALRTGQVEAQENPIGIIEGAKLATMQKYLCLSGHMYSSHVLMISPDVLEDLTAPQLAALRACGLKGAMKSREVAAAAQRDGVARLKQAGMTVIDDVDVPALVAAAKPAKEQLAATYGADRVQRLMNAGV